MSLSALLTAQNIPLIDWSKTTLNNVLIQGDKMHLQSLDNGFVVLEPGVEFMSVDNLTKVVSVSSCTNMFSYEICDSVIDTRINVPAVMHAKTTTTLVNPFDAQNNDTIKPIEAKTIDLSIEAETIDLPIVIEPIEAKTIDLPIVVEPIEAKTIDQPIEATTIDLPIVVEPIEAKTIDLSIVVEPIEAKTIDLPIEAKNIDLSFVVEPIEAQNNTRIPIVVKPVEAKSNIDLSIGVEHNSVVTKNENQIWFIN
jgi:hypothetical protein